ncbi:hypothetical protein KCP74_25290 [Salmonella enterica subsp. enterica]|nr:hypothetical protein KCP74_25290 [Salmonella enterica subsp. enterica]
MTVLRLENGDEAVYGPRVSSPRAAGYRAGVIKPLHHVIVAARPAGLLKMYRSDR